MKNTLILFFILFSSICFGQTLSNVEAVRSGASLTNYSMVGKKLPPPEQDPDVYLFDDWKRFDLNMSSGKVLKDFYININGITNDIELLYKEEVKIIPANLVNSLTGSDAIKEEYVNVGLIPSKFDGIEGFIKVLVEGDITVYERNYIYTRNPTYVEGLSAGDRNYKNFKLTEYYVFSDGKVNKFTKSNKSNLAYFEGNDDAINNIKSKKLKLGKIDNFIEAALFYNGSDN